MVHIPDEDEQQTGQHQRPPQRPAQPQRTPTGQNRRPPTGQNPRTPTGQNQRPPTGQQQAAQDRKKTGPVQKPPQKKRRTEMLSLEPPKRNRGPAIGKMNTRLDSIGGPATRSQRNRNLFGGIGREKSGQTDINPAAQGGSSAPAQRPTLRKPGQGQTVNLGGSAKEVDDMVVRRKGTRRIPKKGGGVSGEAAPLDSMGSGRRPSIDPGPQARDNLPPVVNMPVPQPRQPRENPPPPANRGNTLAGVSAEDLLGEEGRALLEKMRQREAQGQQQQPPQPQRPQGPASPLPPRMQDSSRMAFQSAEYADAPVEPVAPDDELAPQGSFLSGPTRQIQREVVQTPMPVEETYDDQPPPDDLGYERPVDFGDTAPATYVEEGGGTEEEPVARDSAAHDEMEQRAGYLLWLQGVITREEVEDALTTDDDVPESVRELLGESAFTDQVTLYRFLARHESLSPVDLEQVQPSERALAMLRPAIARAYRVVPIEKVGELMLVAAAFPFDPKRLLELRRLTASKVKLFVVTEEEIDLALLKYYPGGASSAATLRSPKPPGLEQPEEDEEDTSAITGEGHALEEQYDPTLSGSDSGLYPPIAGPDDTARPPSDVGLSELDDEDGEPAEEAGSVGDMQDLDESTLSKETGQVVAGPDAEDSGEDSEEDVAADEPESSGIETGPEELDPFAE
ncbi:MAG: hypothetical protein KDB82_10480 [Planctomycetes bacterium]|nr:hypothetical protein [Planctomycetota bacterium]